MNGRFNRSAPKRRRSRQSNISDIIMRQSLGPRLNNLIMLCTAHRCQAWRSWHSINAPAASEMITISSPADRILSTRHLVVIGSFLCPWPRKAWDAQSSDFAVSKAKSLDIKSRLSSFMDAPSHIGARKSITSFSMCDAGAGCWGQCHQAPAPNRNVWRDVWATTSCP